MRNLIPLFRRLSTRYSKQALGCLALGGTASVAYAYSSFRTERFVASNYFKSSSLPLRTFCATKHLPQSSVVNDTKNHALYLTIHLSSEAAVNECIHSLSQLQKFVDGISPPTMRDETDEILYGIGFSAEFLQKLKPETKPAGTVPYSYRARSGPLGDMPSTGGDIFIHAKCHEQGKLFELCMAIIRSLPQGSVAKFEDVYGWVYRGGRDLTGFIDGTENPADEEDRVNVAIDPKSGGSYVVTQKWIHNHPVIYGTKDNVKEQWVGRQIADSTELRKKTITAHVSRMVGSAQLDAPAKYQIVRHSQPWGTVAGDSGLFFIGYSKTPVALDWMLDQMTGLGEDKQSDDIMRMTRCVTGNYWYFPSQPELEKFFNVAGNAGSFRLWR